MNIGWFKLVFFLYCVEFFVIEVIWKFFWFVYYFFFGIIGKVGNEEFVLKIEVIWGLVVVFIRIRVFGF